MFWFYKFREFLDHKEEISAFQEGPSYTYNYTCDITARALGHIVDVRLTENVHYISICSRVYLNCPAPCYHNLFAFLNSMTYS